MSSDHQHRVRTLWLTGILHAFTHLYQIALVPLYLLIKEDLHLSSEGEAPLLVTSMGLAYFLPSYAIGILADRVSRKKLLAFGLALNGLGFVLLAYSPNYKCALASVILAGLGGSFYHPSATALVARLFPVRTGRALGLVAIGASLGYSISPIYTGRVADVLHSWRAPTMQVGIAGIIFAIIFCWLADEEREPAPQPTSKAPSGKKEKLFPTPALWFFFITGSLLLSLRDFGGAGMATLSSLYLLKAHGLSAWTTGLFIAGIFLASAVSNPLCGRLSDHARFRWAFALILLAGVMVGVFPFVPEGGMFVALMMYGFCFLASYPVVEAAVMESVPDSVRGRVFGLFMLCAGLLGNPAHWVVGAAVQKLGPNAAQARAYYPIYGMLSLTVLLSLLGLPCLYAIRKREEALEAHPASAQSIPMHRDNPQSAIEK